MLRNYLLIPVLIVSLLFAGVAGTASAAVISTQAALSADARVAMEGDVRGTLARDDVRAAMQRLGVDAADVDARVAALSDAELQQLQGQLEQLPAGGSLAVIGVVFVVLLILELVGVIDVFKRI